MVCRRISPAPPGWRCASPLLAIRGVRPEAPQESTGRRSPLLSAKHCDTYFQSRITQKLTSKYQQISMLARGEQMRNQVCSALMAILFAATVNAQTTNATLVGTIIDSSSAAVADAMIKVTNTGTGAVREA